MADITDTPAPADELKDFASSFTADEPASTPAAPETPAAAPETPVETPPAAETPPPATEKPVEEEENPFKVDPDAPKPEVEEPKEPEKPTSSDDWSRLRESRNKYKAQAEEREAILREKEQEIAAIKEKAARATELEEIAKRFEEQERELALARVEATVEYKETIEAPLKAIGEQAEILSSSNESDATAVKRMLIEPDVAKQRAMLKEITSGWDEIDRLDLRKMADDARVLLDKQEAMRANAHAAAKEREQISSQKEAEQKAELRKQYAKDAVDAVKSVREKLPFVPLMEGETEDDRYSSLQQKVAQVDFDNQTTRAKALAVASTFALPQAIKTIAAKDAEITSLKEALAKATKDKPSVSPKTSPEAIGEDSGDFFDNLGIPQPKMFGTMSIPVEAG